MRILKVQFEGGGPLDGRQREERVPSGWHQLRIEYRSKDRLHIYQGPLRRNAKRARLQYLGVEEDHCHAM